jgi:hypothetical protein
MKRTLQIALCVRLATGGYLAAIRATPAKAQGDLYIDYQTAVDHERQFDAWTMGHAGREWRERPPPESTLGLLFSVSTIPSRNDWYGAEA